MTIITDDNPLPVREAGYRSIEELMICEGDAYSDTAGSSATPASGGVNVTLGTVTVPNIGKVLIPEKIVISNDKLATMQILLAGDAAGTGRFSSLVERHVVGPGMPYEAKLGVRRAFQVDNGNQSYVMAVRQMLSASPGTDTITAQISVKGYIITDDFDFAAPEVDLWISDSQMTTGPTKTANGWPWLVKSHLRDLDHRTRVVLKSRSGSNAADHEGWRAAGWHDIARVTRGHYALQINDAVQGTDPAAAEVNWGKMWSWFNKRYPDGRLAVYGCSPLENATQEANASALRTRASNWVSGVNSPRLKYINLGGAFPSNDSTYYAASDTPGSRIHPSDKGNAAIAVVANAGLDALGWL